MVYDECYSEHVGYILSLYASTDFNKEQWKTNDFLFFCKQTNNKSSNEKYENNNVLNEMINCNK